jgi:hypothetical protein
MASDGTVQVILNDEERDAWATHLKDVHRDIQAQAIREALDLGLRGDLNIFFDNGACVCTIRTVSSRLVHVEDIP